MGRERIPSTSTGDHRDRHRKTPRKRGLHIRERDSHWHIYGTLRIKGKPVRVRRGTGLPARDETWEDADQIARDIESEIRQEVIHGVKPTRPLGIACREYLGLNEDGEPKPHSRALKIGPSDRRVLAEIVAEFGNRKLRGITDVEWNRFLDKRHAANAPGTRERYCNPILSFLAWCAETERGYCAVPAIKKRSDGASPNVSWKRAQRRAVADLRPDLIVFFFDKAPPHLKAQLYTLWSTGARISSVIFGCVLSDLVLTENRQQITFHDTKNGDDVVAVLHPVAAQALGDYLKWRGKLNERAAPLFLTHRRRAYSDRAQKEGWSGVNKTAFNATKRRAILGLLRESVRARRAGDVKRADALRADAHLIRKVTLHWFRHWFATHAMAQQIPDRMIMEQQGWRDARSLHRYQHDVEAMRRQLVAEMPIGGTSQTRTRSIES